MSSILRSCWIMTLLLFIRPTSAFAGMPSVTLTDVARLRIESLSFFLAGLLLASALIQRLWNYLSHDFTFLPRLTYLKALGGVILWGFLFVLVLTMISGARELLTPGAWEKQGLTYRLATSASSETAVDQLEHDREQKIKQLRAVLWTYAHGHKGLFPSEATVQDIPEDCWRLPDPSGMRYRYVGGKTADSGAEPLAFEPEIYGAQRWVLLTNGTICRMSSEELHRSLHKEKP